MGTFNLCHISVFLFFGFFGLQFYDPISFVWYIDAEFKPKRTELIRDRCLHRWGIEESRARPWNDHTFHYWTKVYSSLWLDELMLPCDYVVVKSTHSESMDNHAAGCFEPSLRFETEFSLLSWAVPTEAICLTDDSTLKGLNIMTFLSWYVFYHIFCKLFLWAILQRNQSHWTSLKCCRMMVCGMQV